MENYQYIGHIESQNGTEKNSIISDLNKALRISSSLKDEISKIRQKFLNTYYQLRFINSVIKQHNDKLSEKSNEDYDYILLSDFFETKKQVILIETPNCEKSETSSKRFLKNFHNLTNDLYEMKKKMDHQKDEKSISFKE